MTENIAEVVNLKVSIGRNTVLNNINIEFQKGNLSLSQEKTVREKPHFLNAWRTSSCQIKALSNLVKQYLMKK